MNAPGSFLDGKVILHPGDCLEVLKTLAPNSVDSIVTDPPYHLTTGKKGGTGPATLNENSPAGRSRIGTGFMGKVWDGGDIAFRPELWIEVLRVLKPGGHLVSFGGTRTYHRMACAIEDAGFEIRDSIQWLYGSGFPKSHNVAVAIDRAAGVAPRSKAFNMKGRGDRAEEMDSNGREFLPPYEASTADARQWSGYGTALKPACEPIVLARKPLSESTVAANVLKWGTGALNIDGCRVEPESPRPDRVKIGGSSNGIYGDGLNNSRAIEDTMRGRWPANVIHDGSEEVVGAFPDLHGAGAACDSKWPRSENVNVYGKANDGMTGARHGDSGSAARFFYQAKSDVRCSLCSANIAENALRTGSTQTGVSVRSDAVDSLSPESADKSSPSSGPASSAASHSPRCHRLKADFAQESAQDSLLSKIVQNVSDAVSLCGSCATTIAHALAEVRRTGIAVPVHFNPSIGSSRETILSRCLASYVASRESTDTILTTTNLRELFGCVFHAIAENINSERVGSEASTRSGSKRLFYSSKADQDDRLGSKHPTVKPLDLIEYLEVLVTPPGGTILDCFAGTGTAGEAAFRRGFRAILIEREAEYCNDIRRRMALCLAGPDERKRESIKARMKDKPEDHGPLFAGTDTPPAGADRFTESSRTNNRADGIEVVNR